MHSIYVGMSHLTSRSPLFFAAFLAVFAALAMPRTARAKDSWTDPYPGVRHLHRTEERQDLHVLLVDLTQPAVSLVATRPEDRGMPVGNFAREYGAEIAINANFFDGQYRSCGMAAGDGKVWPTAYAEGCDMSLGLGALNEAEMFDSNSVLRGPMTRDWMRDVVSGKPWLIHDGVQFGGGPLPAHIHTRHPRTAVGLTEDRHTLIILVADGRRADAVGLDGHELASLMEEFGAYNAFNLDGGGSSELFVGGEGGVQNHPSDGHGRGVGNHLGIRISPDAAWYAARLERVAPPSDLSPGEKANVFATYRNTGRMPWLIDEKSGVELATASGHPNPFFDESAWLSTSVAARAARVVRPGESYTFAFDVAAPMIPGSFAVNLKPRAKDGVSFRADTASLKFRVSADLHAARARDSSSLLGSTDRDDDLSPPGALAMDGNDWLSPMPFAANTAGLTGFRANKMSWLFAFVVASSLGLLAVMRKRAGRRSFGREAHVGLVTQAMAS